MQTSGINIITPPSFTPPAKQVEQGGQTQGRNVEPAPTTQPSETVDETKGILAEHNINLRISTDPTTQSLVVQMVDEKTGEPIRQIPSEVSLRLEANFLKLKEMFLNRFQ